MPIHPLDAKLRKGTVGSPYAVRDFYAINPVSGAATHSRAMSSSLAPRN